MKKALMVLSAMVLLFTSGAWAYEFSADVISSTQGQSFKGKMYVSNNKVRMESSEVVTITDADKRIVWVIMPGQNMYMEQPLDPENIAGAVEKIPGEIERTLIGPDTVNGRSVTKYRVRYSTPDGEAVMFQWMDSAINMPVKTAAEDGSWVTEFRNITAGPQPRALFEVPAGYQKFVMPDMKALMRQAQEEAGQ